MSEMQAGRELDAWVASKVMGIDLTQPCPGGIEDAFEVIAGGEKMLCLRCGAILDEPEEHLPQPVHYSQHIAAAWQVVEEMDRRGSPFVCGFTWKLDIVWKRAGFYAAFGEGTREGAATMPLAICLAALKALEIVE